MCKSSRVSCPSYLKDEMELFNPVSCLGPKTLFMHMTIIYCVNSMLLPFPQKLINYTAKQAGFFPARLRDILAGNSRSHRKLLWIYSRFNYDRKFSAPINLNLTYSISSNLVHLLI